MKKQTPAGPFSDLFFDFMSLSICYAVSDSWTGKKEKKLQ